MSLLDTLFGILEKDGTIYLKCGQARLAQMNINVEDLLDQICGIERVYVVKKGIERKAYASIICKKKKKPVQFQLPAKWKRSYIY